MLGWSKREIRLFKFSSDLDIFAVGFWRLIILEPCFGMNGSGIVKVSEYWLLNLDSDGATRERKR